MSSLLILKFGGHAFSSVEDFSAVANLILLKKREVDHLVVVVSAMGGMTDHLLSLAEQVAPHSSSSLFYRERDLLVTVGERVSMSLLSMALAKKGCEAQSFTGSQSGIITTANHGDARIIDVRPRRLLSALQKNKVVIVAGFQGVSVSGEVTSLGRGGSDTTAVALALALGAERVEFFKDVPGIFSEDPKKYPEAKHLPHLTHAQVLDLVKLGAEVLSERAVLLAQKHKLPLQLFSVHQPHGKMSCVESKRSAKKSFIYEESA